MLQQIGLRSMYNKCVFVRPHPVLFPYGFVMSWNSWGKGDSYKVTRRWNTGAASRLWIGTASYLKTNRKE